MRRQSRKRVSIIAGLARLCGVDAGMAIFLTERVEFYRYRLTVTREKDLRFIGSTSNEVQLQQSPHVYKKLLSFPNSAD
jgi:hypothetical protein